MIEEDFPETATRTRTAKIWLRADGIVSVRIAPGVIQNIEDARANLDGAVALRGGLRRPIMIDLRLCEPLEPHVRHHYSGTKLGEWFQGLALVVPASNFGRIMGNIYLRIARAGVPIKLFHDPISATSWLKELPQ